MASVIKSFTKSGKAIAGTSNKGRGITVGHKTEDGRVFKHPRVTTDRGLLAGAKVVNPQALALRGKRHGTLGIGLTGDKRY